MAEAKARAAIAREAARIGSDASKAGSDPLTVLENALSDVVSLKDRLKVIVDRLETDALRYEGRAGEQIRGELSAYQSALRDTVKAAETMVKLGIAERRQALNEAQSLMLVSVIRAILERLDLSEAQRVIAADVVPQELRAISEPAGSGRNMPRALS